MKFHRSNIESILRYKVILLLVLALTLFSAVPVFATEPQVTTDSAIIMDAKTGQILYEKNAYVQRAPASTTKMITAILAIENGNLTDMVTISDKAAHTEESSMELKVNEKIPLESLLYGALLWSGNDACVAIAEHIAGDETKFVQMMNDKAKDIGAINTNFKNTNGLPDEQHYSTAYDLAVIARYALKNPIFARIVSTRVKLVTGETNQWSLDNTNRLLWSYEGADGVKTGTTNAAGPCLVSSATRNGRQIIAVVLHSADRYGDSIRLLDHGFNDYKPERILTVGNSYGSLKVIDGDLETVNVTVKNNIDVVVPVGNQDDLEKKIELKSSVLAPIKKGQVVGSYDIYIKGKKVAGTELVTSTDIKEASFYQKLSRYLKEKF